MRLISHKIMDDAKEKFRIPQILPAAITPQADAIITKPMMPYGKTEFHPEIQNLPCQPQNCPGLQKKLDIKIRIKYITD
jgi:hypothetical protein